MWDFAYKEEGVKKTDEKFSIDEGTIEVMDHYKYLGCSLTEHLEYKVILEEIMLMSLTKSFFLWKLTHCFFMFIIFFCVTRDKGPSVLCT